MIHAITAMLGVLVFMFGMWTKNSNPLILNETFVMIIFIVGGVLLLLAFGLFEVISIFR